jgi:hypothetical protein
MLQRQERYSSMAVVPNQRRLLGALASVVDPIQHREFKLLVKPERFVKQRSYRDFWKLARRTAKSLGAKLSKPDKLGKVQMREVLFYDTPHFRLYNNGFILRTRTPIKRGTPEYRYEMVLKFRHPDRDVAAAVDVRPLLPSVYTIKFKEELLPARDKLGTHRSVFSHNCELDTPNLVLLQRFEIISQVFPALRGLGANPKAMMAVVNGIVIDEELVQLGELDFTGKMTAKASVAIWRNHATRQPMTGEFAFQLRFERPEVVPKKAWTLAEAFYHQLQLDAEDWIQNGTTKTALIYGLGKTAVRNKE